MKIERIEDYKIKNNDIVSVKVMGSIVEVCWVQRRNSTSVIKKLDGEHYIYLPTGEIKEFSRGSNRTDNILEVSRSLKRLRDYINFNVTDISKCRWITLTYKENMTDTKRLYKDFEKFIKKFRYKYGNFEYIVSCEPQARGAWHMHLITIFNNIAPFIPNSDIEKLWGQGFTKTKALKGDISNIGIYLTSYLGDMELNEYISTGKIPNFDRVKEVNVVDGFLLDKPKKFVKGGRLHMYPTGFNLYRKSRGVKPPVKEYMPFEAIKEKIGFGQPTFQKTISLTEPDSNFTNTICYQTYNILK